MSIKVTQYKLTFILSVLLVLNILDYITTVIGVTSGIPEANPTSAQLINEGRFEEVKIYYANVCICSSMLLTFVVERFQRIPASLRGIYQVTTLLGVAVVILYVVAVINNLYQIILI